MHAYMLHRIALFVAAFAVAAGCSRQRPATTPGSLPLPAGSTAAGEKPRDPTVIYNQMGLIATGSPLSYVGKIAYFATPVPDTTMMLASISIPNRMLSFVRDGDTYRAPYEIRLRIAQGATEIKSVESMEIVRVASFKEVNRTDESVIFQNYFRLYGKLAGMTGTAETEAAELASIYGLEVASIPTNRPVARLDEGDLVYKTEAGKVEALISDVKERNEKGQPVLMGTVSIEKSESLSRALEKIGVKHEVLNAKQHAREADIIAQAGRPGAVTVATNMAGRGVDIMLGGNPEGMARTELKRRGIDQSDPSHEELEKKLAEEFAAQIEHYPGRNHDQ